MKTHFELKSLLFVLITFGCVVLLTDFSREIGLIWFLYAVPALVSAYYYGTVGAVVMGGVSFVTLALWIWYLDALSAPAKSSNNLWEFILGISFLLAAGIAFGVVADRWRKSREELEHCSVYEPLTGLYNYGYFLDRLNQEISRADRYDYPLSLIMIDIDRFRDFNDTYGNQKGNLLLSKIAKIIKRCVRTADVVCRYGGEVFAVVLPNVDSDADVVAERIRKEIEKASFEGDIEHPQVRKTISCGVAAFPADATSDTELIVASDEALFMAKEAGRNKVCSYSRHCAQSNTVKE